jgi:hypothetical protein
LVSVSNLLRACAEITSHLGARAGRTDARRRDAGDAVSSSRNGNKADARPPPRPFGLRPAGPQVLLLAPYIPTVCSSLVPRQRAWGPAAKCNLYSLTGPNSLFPKQLPNQRRYREWCAVAQSVVEYALEGIYPLSYFDVNLAQLSRRQPDLAAQLRQVQSSHVKVFLSASGNPSASYERGTSSFALHSRYDPAKEARQILNKQEFSGADFFILLGFGLGYILDALLEMKEAASNHYFIVESDLKILKAAFEARDLTSLIALQHIHFAWPASGPDLAEQWQCFFDPVQARKSAFITYLPCVALDPPLYKAAAEIIQSQTFQIFTDINTLVGKAEVFLENFVKNIRKAILAPGVIKFAKLFPKVPAIIVSAGPSLDKNVHDLRGFQNNALILSTDTALKPLLAAGIDPHFVLTGDPSYLNFLHLKGAPTKEALLVAEASSFPAVFEEFGRTLTCTFENSSLRSLSDLLGNKGSLRAWGSVATMALDFALLLNCDPIIFIGQDLAHTDGNVYCTGICFDDEWFAEVLNSTDWHKKQKDLRSSRRTVIVDDIFGRPVESTDKLTSYWNWIIKTFRDHPEVRFINATEGGILRDNVEISSLRDALHRECGNNLDLRNRLDCAYAEAKKSSLLYAGVDLSRLLGESISIREVLRKGLSLCESNGIHSPGELMNQLEGAKESIYIASHLAPLMDCLNQMGNFSFLRRRNAIVREGLNSQLLPELCATYSEYFSSVRAALSKIDIALLQITANLNEKSSVKTEIFCT